MNKEILINSYFDAVQSNLEELIPNHFLKMQNILTDLKDTITYLNRDIPLSDVNILKNEVKDAKKRLIILTEQLNKSKEDFKKLCNIASQNKIRINHSVFLPDITFGDTTESNELFRLNFTKIGEAVHNKQIEMKLFEK